MSPGSTAKRRAARAPSCWARQLRDALGSARFAPSTMACSVDHLASDADLTTIRRVNSVADAAIATNAGLAVTRPHL